MSLIRAAKDAGHIALGAGRLWFGQPRTIALILSSMRSGSTLLKALLAQAPDVSHLPEIAFAQYRTMPPLKAYDLVCRLSPRRIIVLKRPVYGELVLPFPPAFMRLQVIVLIRNAIDVATSVMRMTQQYSEEYPEPWSAEQAVAYWRDSYTLMLEHPELRRHDVLQIRYEDLVARPAAETARAFSHLGSVQRNGVERYGVPEGFEWRWGSDDGGERIRSLVVRAQAKDAAPPDPRVIEALRADVSATALMQRFGYALPWEDAVRA